MNVDTTESAGMEVDDEEEEAMIIERGWLGTVEILIQMADILLASRLFALSLSHTVACSSATSSSPYTNVASLYSFPVRISTTLSTIAPSPHVLACHVLGKPSRSS